MTRSKKSEPLTFGQAIAAARVARGWSQKELADAMGVHRPAVSRVEGASTGRDAGGVRESFVRRAADALGMSIAELLADC